jgi:membrane protein DedA with SNARE-associated domain
MKHKKHIRYILTGVLIFFYILMFLVLKDRITNPSAILDSIENLYSQYGYTVVLLGGLLEGIFLVGMYVPGSTVILLGAALAKTEAVSLPIIILAGVCGLVTGYCVNYILGKYGWHTMLASSSMLQHLEKAQKKLQTYEKRSFIFGFSSPFLATFLTTAAGVLCLPFKKFIITAIVVQLFWTSLYSIIAYIFGIGFVEIFLRYFGVVMFVLLLVWGRKLLFPNK